MRPSPTSYPLPQLHLFAGQSNRTLRLHLFRESMRVPLPREQVFAFFADATNLQRITPPELRIEILTPRPIPMQEGTLIDYRLRLFGIPLLWQARIAHWQPPIEFVDEQLYGPYRLWRHTHRFYDEGGQATIIEDVVCYALPFWPVGEILHPLIRLELRGIFRFRRSAVQSCLCGSSREEQPPPSP
jgi:ligand-binding SRPBCC domain-containing protein